MNPRMRVEDCSPVVEALSFKRWNPGYSQKKFQSLRSWRQTSHLITHLGPALLIFYSAFMPVGRTAAGCRPYGPQNQHRVPFHALTDVSIDWRSFGPIMALYKFSFLCLIFLKASQNAGNPGGWSNYHPKSNLAAETRGRSDCRR
jgi:hypothetical protein